MIGLLATPIHSVYAGHDTCNTTGYVEIAPNVYVLNQTTPGANEYYCASSPSYAYVRQNLTGPLPSLKDCHYLMDRIRKDQFNTSRIGPTEWYQVLKLFHAIFSPREVVTNFDIYTQGLNCWSSLPCDRDISYVRVHGVGGSTTCIQPDIFRH
ncbi:hypothetical protein QBC40DRAFT_298046 [Triangularia verruculosa]|uniref:Uncharacterized protein n=1 Tax=Triangularia verruculosa TaxID=2587418 RepID=A0AAN6XG24_9PEZI|nr:hypothetical protein QBC40DRAFT_298046 [Triangularia verruculosa]